MSQTPPPTPDHAQRLQQELQQTNRPGSNRLHPRQTPDHNRSSSQVKAGGQVVEKAVEQVEHEQRPRWRVIRRGRLWIGVCIAAVIALSVLAVAAHTSSLLPGDLPFTREFQENRAPLLMDLMYAVSFIGTGIVPVIITTLVLLLLWIARLRIEALFLALGLLADLFGAALKSLVGRHRPTPNLVHVAQQITSPSFPSGHTLHYTVFYGFLAFVMVINFRNSWQRNVLIGVCIALILLVGPSRVYLGEHWLSDVVGGYLLGGLCLVMLSAGYLWAKAHFEIVIGPPWLRRLPRNI